MRALAVNASIDGHNIVYKKDINLGIAVALDNLTLVPKELFRTRITRLSVERMSDATGIPGAGRKPCVSARNRAVSRAVLRCSVLATRLRLVGSNCPTRSR